VSFTPLAARSWLSASRGFSRRASCHFEDGVDVSAGVFGFDMRCAMMSAFLTWEQFTGECMCAGSNGSGGAAAVRVRKLELLPVLRDATGL